MNVNSMYQLLGAVQKNPKVVGEAVANGAGTGFEDMLQQAAGDKKPVDNSKPQNQTQDKPTDSQKPAQTTDETAKQPNQSESAGKSAGFGGGTGNQPACTDYAFGCSSRGNGCTSGNCCVAADGDE